jgi:hypothetical protein
VGNYGGVGLGNYGGVDTLSTLARTARDRHYRTVTLDTDDDRCPVCDGDVDIALVGVVTIDGRAKSVDSGMCSTCGKRLSRPHGARRWLM